MIRTSTCKVRPAAAEALDLLFLERVIVTLGRRPTWKTPG
jgi:hypothetical protein